MLETTVLELFGVSSGGYIRVEAQDAEIYAMELFGDSRRRGGLLALDPASASPRVYAAHLASGFGLDTTINLINLGPATAVTLEAFDSDGGLIDRVRLASLARGGRYRATAEETFDLDAGLTAGWLRVTGEEGALLGNIVFGDSANYLASLPLQSKGSREFILSHVAQSADIFTGITLVNAGEAFGLVSLEVFDAAGTKTGLVFLEVEPGRKVARLLSEWIPGIEQNGGFIRVRSNTPLLGFELFGDNRLEFLAAVPAQTVVH